MRTSVVLLVAGALAAAPAHAADDYTPAQLRAIGARYAACVIKGSASQARRYVVSTDKAPPILGNCLNIASRTFGSEMRFTGSMYRYALAEALLVRDYPQGPPEGVAAAPALAQEPLEPLDEATLPRDPKRAAEVRQRYDRYKAYHAMDILGECVARRDPQHTDALIRSTLDQPDETAAFEALKPAIAQCVPADNTFRFTRTVLRGALASSLYRLSYAVRPVAGRS